MAAINPQEITGKWHSGRALDKHTIESVYLGPNEYGHDSYKTTRTELGELLYRLKNHGDESAASDIIAAVAGFLQHGAVDLIIPVPPSANRRVQPVILLAKGIGTRIGVPVVDCITTTRDPTQLKNITDPTQRQAAVAGLYAVNVPEIAGKRVLLFDDLYRSGTTMNAITDVLLQQGRVAKVYALTVTCTRRNR